MPTFRLVMKGLNGFYAKHMPHVAEGRHEMLNEINREEVYQDVLHWLEGHMPRK